MTKHPITPFMPFADESATIQIGELSIENRLDRISIFGSLDITCDKAGLAAALVLRGRLEQIVEVLKLKSLPEHIETVAPTKINNPLHAKDAS